MTNVQCTLTLVRFGWLGVNFSSLNLPKSESSQVMKSFSIDLSDTQIQALMSDFGAEVNVLLLLFLCLFGSAVRRTDRFAMQRQRYFLSIE
jgi:hypothetical protein